jgi:hypothetical protein
MPQLCDSIKPEALTPGSNEAPRDAFRFAVGPMQFAETQGDTSVFPFTMTARSGDPIQHWYWGRIVHDMDGMVTRKESVTVDYAHGYDDVIGYANQFDAGPEGLKVSGALVSVAANDKADEVYRKGKAGVPYESSIDWEGEETELEYIPEGVSTEVNAKQFEGPGFVVRKWPLRAIAVCRYGADPQTKTQFSAGDPSGVRKFTLKENPMTKPTLAPPAVTATLPAEAGDGKQLSVSDTTPASITTMVTSPGTISLDQLRQFSTEFGDKGIEFLTAGLTLDAARYQFAVHQRDQLSLQNKQIAEQLEAATKQLSEATVQLKQLSGAVLGQETPLNDPPNGEAEAAKRQFANLGDGRAAFAASMKKKA